MYDRFLIIFVLVKLLYVKINKVKYYYKYLFVGRSFSCECFVVALCEALAAQFSFIWTHRLHSY